MDNGTSGEVTRLLQLASRGHKDALSELIPLVYEDLRRVAHRFLAAERPGHTLQPTALVHEVYVRLIDQRAQSWENRVQFFAVAARLMRRILIDHARKRHAQKRGGNAVTLAFQDSPGADARLFDILMLDELLTRLAAVDHEQAKLVELRFFAGLSVDETALVLHVSAPTVKREWSAARAWLLKELARATQNDSGAVAAS